MPGRESCSHRSFIAVVVANLDGATHFLLNRSVHFYCAVDCCALGNQRELPARIVGGAHSGTSPERSGDNDRSRDYEHDLRCEKCSRGKSMRLKERAVKNWTIIPISFKECIFLEIIFLDFCEVAGILAPFHSTAHYFSTLCRDKCNNTQITTTMYKYVQSRPVWNQFAWSHFM